MQRFLQTLAFALAILCVAPVIGSPVMVATAQAESIQIPTISTTNADPTVKIKAFGGKVADIALVTVTVLTAIMLAVALGFMAFSKPIPKLFAYPLWAGLGATSIGWVLNLLFS